MINNIKKLRNDLLQLKQKVEAMEKDKDNLSEKDAERFIDISNELFSTLGSFNITEKSLNDMIPNEFKDNETLGKS